MKHQKLHEELQYCCPHCNKNFKEVKHLNYHVKKRHLNTKIKSSVGWFNVDPGAGAGVVNSDRKKGRTIHHCREEGCEWKSKDKKLLKKHYDKQHPPVPPLPKVFKCEGCEHVAPNNWAHVRHISTCIHYKALQPRICGVITNKSMIEVAHEHNISEATACSMMKSLEKKNPTVLFEKNLRKRLRECRDALLGWYDADQMHVVTNRKGDTLTTATVLLKNLNHFITTLIKEKGIRSPRIVIGGDGGNSKLIFTLQVFDEEDIEARDYCGYSLGGVRRSILIAGVDHCKEYRENLDKILEQLKIWKVEHPLQLIGDGKLKPMLAGIYKQNLNINYYGLCVITFWYHLLGVGSPGSKHSCIYCTGHKCDHQVCEVCDKTFASERQLEQHYCGHFMKDLEAKFGEMVPGLKCGLCGTVFKQKRTLLLHLGCKHGKINDILEEKGHEMVRDPNQDGECRGRWVKGEMRQPRRIREKNRQWKEKWEGKWESKEAQEDLKNFESCVGEPIQLPPGDNLL